MIYAAGMLYGSTERSLLVNDHKVMFNAMDGRYSLFDLSNDPGEINDLTQRLPEAAVSMRTALETMHARLESDYDPSDKRASSEEEENALIEALRSLGYVK